MNRRLAYVSKRESIQEPNGQQFYSPFSTFQPILNIDNVDIKIIFPLFQSKKHALKGEEEK